ncbi:MAG: hypothetical protein JJU41_13240 [Bacteroidetes bacterium]|nr:hypothetical protein [Bacteroidota bacterium]MCH8523345.1 hypothetical protein [Balneolales bacterium]
MKLGRIHITLAGICISLVILCGCTNPFAPKILEGDILSDILGNPATVEGFYIRFQNAYQFRDTTLYGQLIHPDFIFSYRDQEQNVDINWGRAEEMNSTSRLFQNSRDIQLQWNNIIDRIDSPTELETRIVRRFNLTVLLDGADLFRTDGAAVFTLTRSDTTSNWRLIRWRDESDL